MISTGLLFGSFNPVHIGHIAIAGYMKEFESVDEIWFVISPQNPFKSLNRLVSPEARLNMMKMAIKEYPSFRVCDIEFSMPLPSYTLHTLENLRESYPDRDFYIITGTDNIGSIELWKGGTILLDEYKYLIYPRLYTDNSAIRKFKNARIVDAPVMEISSTFIRESIMQGKDMRPFVPRGVYDYISENGLYSDIR
jgi:nicotinate-nucleotide adenylyltransferase